MTPESKIKVLKNLIFSVQNSQFHTLSPIGFILFGNLSPYKNADQFIDLSVMKCLNVNSNRDIGRCND